MRGRKIVQGYVLVFLRSLLLSNLMVRTTSSKIPSFNVGDRLVQPFMCRKCVMWPYHWSAAISRDEIFSAEQVNGNNYVGFFLYYKNYPTHFGELMKNKGKCSRSEYLGDEKLVKLARKFAGLPQRQFIYHLHRCNCKHYIEFITKGHTTGHIWDPAYWLLSRDCPLYKAIDKNTDIDDLEFYLENKAGQKYYLNKMTTYLEGLH